MARDRSSLFDILRAATRTETFIEGMTETEFLADLKTQAAVVRQIEIVGEAAKRLSEAFRAAHPSVPWREIAGMRDKLIHG